MCIHNTIVFFYLIAVLWNIQSLHLLAQSKELSLPKLIASVNSSSNDFAPFVAQDGTLIFCSDRSSSGVARLYSSQQMSFSSFSAPILLHESINAPRENVSFLTFDKSTNTAYFSGFRQLLKQAVLNIYQTKKLGSDWSSTWSPIQLVEALQSDFFTSHPTISPSGKTMVFASNRDGGFGGVDLWTTAKTASGIWETPVNLGNVLNSDADEITPFLASDDTLYFSSNGFGGKGGYEIFMTTRIGGIWRAPIPLVELNSEFDDSDLCRSSDGNVFYFASNRAGGLGGYDLYESRFASNAQNIPAVEYSVVPGNLSLTVEEFQSTESVPLLGYVFFGENSATIPSSMHAINSSEASTFRLDSLEATNESVYANMLNIIGMRLREFPKATLTITGCANEKSSQENSSLGRKRAQAVAEYLSSVWKIDSKRLIIQERGLPEKPSNNTIAEGAEENRRAELRSNDARILSIARLARTTTEISPPVLDMYVDARPRNLVKEWQIRINTVPEGRDIFAAKEFSAPPKALRIPLDKLAGVETLEKISYELKGLDSLGRLESIRGTVPIQHITLRKKKELHLRDKEFVRLSLVLFDFNESRLTDEHKKTLEEIASEISPDAVVTITGLTDAIGSEAYNKQLANSRAKEVLDFLRLRVPTTAVLKTENGGETDNDKNATAAGRFYSRTVRINIQR